MRLKLEEMEMWGLDSGERKWTLLCRDGLGDRQADRKAITALGLELRGMCWACYLGS